MIKIKEGGHLGRFMRQRGIQDVLVVVERTGNYHQATRRAFVKASFDTRLLSAYGGFATKQFRLPANPGDKTDNNDLAAIHRAATQGFAPKTSLPKTSTPDASAIPSVPVPGALFDTTHTIVPQPVGTTASNGSIPV